MDKNKKGIIIMICNMVIMVANYFINIFSQSSDTVAFIASKVMGA